MAGDVLGMNRAVWLLDGRLLWLAFCVLRFARSTLLWLVSPLRVRYCVHKYLIHILCFFPASPPLSGSYLDFECTAVMKHIAAHNHTVREGHTVSCDDHTTC